MLDFARADLLSQVELAVLATPTALFTAQVKTEITLIMAAPEGDTAFTLFQGGAAPGNRLLYQFPVTPLYQGPILATQSTGASIGMDAGDVLTVTLDSGARLTLTVYGVTARIPVL